MGAELWALAPTFDQATSCEKDCSAQNLVLLCFTFGPETPVPILFFLSLSLMGMGGGGEEKSQSEPGGRNLLSLGNALTHTMVAWSCYANAREMLLSFFVLFHTAGRRGLKS